MASTSKEGFAQGNSYSSQFYLAAVIPIPSVRRNHANFEFPMAWFSESGYYFILCDVPVRHPQTSICQRQCHWVLDSATPQSLALPMPA